jgi:ABC-type nitrate/sulfonate/bicarbonate transport system substrate-binding protein
MKHQRTWGAVIALLLAVCATNATAADKIRLGKANSNGWTFIPADIGMSEGIFAKYGIELEIAGLAGDAKLQQALIADALDIALGSGPSMAFVAKGAPVVTVAAYAGEPRQIAIVVLPDSPIHTIPDMKGKTLGISTVGSLTEWLGGQMGVQEGWGPNGVKTLPLGDNDANLAALRTHQIDGMLAATEVGYQLEEKKIGRNFMSMEKYAPHFHAHVIFARQELAEKKPDVVERFLKGFFASIIFMKAHREETSKLAAKFLHESVEIADKTYDHEIGMLETDGRFDPKAIEVLKTSFVDMGILKERPRDDQLFTTKFVPVKP